MKKLEEKVNLIKEEIISQEKKGYQNFLLTEMKRIGIEKLPYSYSSLRNFIDSKTMDVHYNNHYKTYVKKLNDALSKKDYGDVELEEIVKSISRYNKTIRNNAGGAFNHAMFWKMLSPKKQKIEGDVVEKIKKEYGSISEFKKEFEETAKERFGSGWVWLVLTKNNKLKIVSTSNQDNPLMNVIDNGYPLLGLDLWEHAFYLKYQSKKDEYIKNFWDVVNWEFVNKLYKLKTNKETNESVKITKNQILESLGGHKINEEDSNSLPRIFVDGKFNTKIFREFILRGSGIYKTCSPYTNTELKPSEHVTEPCVGKISTDTCKTGEGIIGGKYAVGLRGGFGEWSIVNWFDTNSVVHEKIITLAKQNGFDQSNINEWIVNNIYDIAGNDGKYTSEISDLILSESSGTLYKGTKIEKIGMDALTKHYPNIIINKFCDGDVRDRLDGQDLVAVLGTTTKHIQIKPLYAHLKLVESLEHGVYFEVGTYFDINRYDPKNVQIIGFVDESGKYIFFDLIKGQYKQVANNSKYGPKYLLRFNNEPKIKSMVLKPQQDPEIKKMSHDEKLNYYIGKISDYEAKVKHLRQVVDTLKGNGPMKEQISFYKNQISLLTEIKNTYLG
jgi:Fe-Mn family superoxide dismutase